MNINPHFQESKVTKFETSTNLYSTYNTLHVTEEVKLSNSVVEGSWSIDTEVFCLSIH